MPQGSVPAAVLGTIVPTKAGVVSQGVFDNTPPSVGLKAYATKLSLVNVPVAITKGLNAGFGGLEIYDFGTELLLFKTANVALTTYLLDANITDASSAYSVGLGTATATDVVKASATTTENNLVAYTTVTFGAGTLANPDTADARTATLASSIGGPQIFDGTGGFKKVFLNFNVVLAQVTATGLGFQVNGTIDLRYEDCGADL